MFCIMLFQNDSAVISNILKVLSEACCFVCSPIMRRQPAAQPRKTRNRGRARKHVLGRPPLGARVIAPGDARPTQEKWENPDMLRLQPRLESWQSGFNQGNEDIMKYLLSQYATH